MLTKFSRAGVACVLIALGLADAPAQSGESGSPDTISLPEALSRTLADNASLRALGFDVPAAEGRLQQSTFRPSPEINVALQDVFGTDSFRGVRSAETTISLNWVLERGIRERIVNASRARLDVTTAEMEIARLDVAAETARRYIECLVFQARYANAERGVELARDAVDAVRRRVEASRAPQAELARAEAELARSELRLEDYEHELRSAYHRLSAQWSITEPEFSSVAGNLSGTPAPDPFEVLLARVEQNPDLVAFVSQSRLAEAELNLARARSRPGWSVSGGLRRIESSDDWAVVGGVTIPLRMGNRNQGRIAEAGATLSQVEAASEAARISIETELFVLYQELIHNIELADRLETDVAPRLEAAVTDMRRAFELGRSSYLEFRAVQSELLEVAYEILDAHADAHRLSIEIERLTGESLSPLPRSEQ